jgi:hypothetical protein
MPISCGLKTLAVAQTIGTIALVGLAAMIAEVDAFAGTVVLFVTLPLIISVYFYLRYLVDNNNKNHQKNLIYAVWLSFFYCFLSNAF